MSNKTCGECKLNGVDCRCKANEKACEEFEQKVITNGDKIIACGNAGIAAFVCGVLNDRSENTFRKLLDFLNAPAESEGEDE